MNNLEAIAELKLRVLNIEANSQIDSRDDFEQIYNLLEIIEDFSIAANSGRDLIVQNSQEKDKFESELKTTEEKFRIVVRNANALIFIIDVNGIINLSEGKALGLFKFLPNQLNGMSIYEIYEETPEVISAVNSALEGITTTSTLIIQDYIFEAVFSPFLDYYGNVGGVVTIAVDISERVKMQQEREELIQNLNLSGSQIMKDAGRLMKLNDNLIDSEQRLQKMNDEKDKFISIISHDLRSPFSGMLGIIDGVLNYFDNYSKSELKGALQMLKKNSHDLFELLENLLIWARVNRGKIDIQLEQIPLFAIVKHNIELLINNAIPKNITITNQVSKNIFVLADENMLNTVFRNLISNAIKFTNISGEIIISTQLALEDDKIEIWVQDDGIGMSDDIVNSIFNLNRQYTSLGTSNEKGTGLGLFICKEMIAQNNGRIWVESKLGHGTCFKLELNCLKNGDSDVPEYEDGSTEQIQLASEEFFTISKEDLIKYDSKTLELIVRELKEVYLPECIEVESMQILGLITDFSMKLINFAKEYDCKILINYAEELNEKVKMMDVIEMNKYLNYFPSLIKEFETLIITNN